MKFLLVLLFVGFASAAFHEVLDKVTEDVLQNFLRGMEEVQPLHEALGIEQNESLQRFERNIKDELARYLKEAFEKTLKKIDDAVKAGKQVNEEALMKLKQLKDKMEDLEIADDEVEGLKEKMDYHLRQILEKMGILSKRSVDSDESIDPMIGDVNLRSLIQQIRKMILDKMNVETLKKSLAKVVGQGSERLCEWLSNKGKEKVVGFIDRLLDSDDKRKRSVSDFYEHLKDFVKDLDVEFKEKFQNFGDWLKNLVDKGLDLSTAKIDDIKAIAEELLKRSKDVGQETAAEMFCYLRTHKDKFGNLYHEMRDRVMKKVFSR